MAKAEIVDSLAGPHQAVLSLSREGRGPLAIPMSYVFHDDAFWMITSPDTLHGRLMTSLGRATMTVHHDDVSPRRVEQWYVIAEGTIAFTEDDPEPVLRLIMAKDRGREDVEAWVSQSLPSAGTVAVLTPERLGGYHGVSELGSRSVD